MGVFRNSKMRLTSSVCNGDDERTTGEQLTSFCGVDCQLTLQINQIEEANFLHLVSKWVGIEKSGNAQSSCASTGRTRCELLAAGASLPFRPFRLPRRASECHLPSSNQRHPGACFALLNLFVRWLFKSQMEIFAKQIVCKKYHG